MPAMSFRNTAVLIVTDGPAKNMTILVPNLSPDTWMKQNKFTKSLLPRWLSIKKEANRSLLFRIFGSDSHL